MDNERETASLEAASHVEYLAKPVDCALFRRPDDGDYSVYWLLLLEAALKLLLELGQVKARPVVNCDADYILGPNSSDGCVG